MKIKILELEEIKPNGEVIFETSKLMIVPGKGLLNLASKTQFDYKFIKQHQNNIAGVVLPPHQYVKNSEQISSHQFSICKGIQVTLKDQDVKECFNQSLKSLEGKEASIDFVYIPYNYEGQNNKQVKNIVELVLRFQSHGKFVVLNVTLSNNKSIEDFQNALSLLTYHLSLSNAFLEGLMIQINLLDLTFKNKDLVNIAVIRRCLPAKMKNVAVKITSEDQIKTIYSWTKQKNTSNWTFTFSIDDTKLNPEALTMACSGIYF